MKPMIRFDTKSGRFVSASDGGMEALTDLIKRTGASGRRADHEAMAAAVIGPIKQVADYQEWTKGIFAPHPVADGEIVRIALKRPSVIVLNTSLNGEVLFTRPRLKYTTIEYQSMDTGIEVGWDDLKGAGWNVMEDLIVEAGQALARKRDAARVAVLDAAAVLSSHDEESTGLVMAKSVVDGIFKEAAQLNWKIQSVYVNSGTIMDMADWALPATTMWETPPEMGAQIVKQGYVTGYGGANWMAYPEVGATYVYLLASPSDMGALSFSPGTVREAHDINIKNRTDLFTWDETNSTYLGNPYAVWRIHIVQS